MRVNVLGIDASPTATGLALPSGETVTLKKFPIDLKYQTAPRLSNIRREMRLLTQSLEIDLAVLEGYNYGLKTFGPVFEIGEVAGVIKLELADKGIPVLIVSPGGRSKYGCGIGNKGKKIVKNSWEEITGIKFKDDNQCDAHIMREMGRRLLKADDLVSVQVDRLLALEVLKQEQQETLDQAIRRIKYRQREGITSVSLWT